MTLRYFKKSDLSLFLSEDLSRRFMIGLIVLLKKRVVEIHHCLTLALITVSVSKLRLGGLYLVKTKCQE